MKKYTIYVVFCLLIFVFNNSVMANELPQWMNQNGWVSHEEVCESMNRLNGTSADCSEGVMVTQNAFFAHWAGEMISFYYDKSVKEFTNIKVKITWVTDQSPYNCGSIVQMRRSEMKDFEKRSYELRRCN